MTVLVTGASKGIGRALAVACARAAAPVAPPELSQLGRADELEAALSDTKAKYSVDMIKD